MRLIDADALKDSFDERYDSAFMQMHTRDNKEHWNGVCGGVNWGRNTIADAPTVDAVVLPCGLGNKVYQTDGIMIYESTICEITLTTRRSIFVTENIAFDERAIGKSIFLTREEAEAALAKMG